MKCNKCGGINPDGSKYCQFCGDRLDIDEGKLAEKVIEDMDKEEKVEEKSETFAQSPKGYVAPLLVIDNTQGKKSEKDNIFDEKGQEVTKSSYKKPFDDDNVFDEAKKDLHNEKKTSTKSNEREVFDEFDEKENDEKKQNSEKDEDPEKSEAKKGKSIAWLSYFGIFFLIPLLAGKDNAFTQYHAKQGITLFIFTWAIEIVLSIVKSILIAAKAIQTGGVFTTINSVISFISFVFLIIGVVNVVNEQKKPLPIIGKVIFKD